MLDGRAGRRGRRAPPRQPDPGARSCRPARSIVDAILRALRRRRVRVSEAGIREGAILAVAHAGHAWRDRLPELAHGWRRRLGAPQRLEAGDDPPERAPEPDARRRRATDGPTVRRSRATSRSRPTR